MNAQQVMVNVLIFVQIPMALSNVHALSARLSGPTRKHVKVIYY